MYVRSEQKVDEMLSKSARVEVEGIVEIPHKYLGV